MFMYKYINNINLKIRTITEKIDKINKLLSQYNDFIYNNNFIDYWEVEEFKNKILIPTLPPFSIIINPFAFYKYLEYKKLKSILNNKINMLQRSVEEHNNEIAKTKIKEFDFLCGTVENKNLDFQQKDAIVRDYNNQLVIAGAGSGKTTTIIGKIKYLVKNNLALPNQILVLSFTNASSAELKERIIKEINCEIDTYTFHKLGLEIIKECINTNINIYSKSLSEFISKTLLDLTDDSEYLNKLIEFILNGRYSYLNEFDFYTKEEYIDFLKNNPPTTLNGEIVKSYGEMEIANFLYKNSINYIYEENYKYNITSTYQSQYKPDFYLPDYNIYIEYFGIDENGNVPSYFKGNEDKSAKQLYNESIEWKRNIHSRNKTIMVECYAYEKKKGILCENLKRKLLNCSVSIEEKSDKQIWQEIRNKNYGISNEITRTFETVINLIKSNNYTFEEVERLVAISENYYNNLLAISLIKPIYLKYNTYLIETNQIDFNDMINLATNYVNAGLFSHDYKYVIVDEYQDISKSRFNLLYSLRKRKNYKVFCVGDDWQSIYRFSGSDINLIINFDKYWGKTYVNKIETTYRFSNELANISSKFIMKNNYQIRKNIVGFESEFFPLSMIREYTVNKGINSLEKRLQLFENNSTVFLIGRYNFDIDLLKNRENFIVKFNNITQNVEVMFLKRKDLKITFLTAHKSKGLQADYVIIMNNKKTGLGFPCKIIDFEVINVFLEQKENFPDAEERRLFYVAMTRSRKKTLFFTVYGDESIFIQELYNEYQKSLLKGLYECPLCGKQLIVRKSNYGEFLGCTDYPNCTYIREKNK